MTITALVFTTIVCKCQKKTIELLTPPKKKFCKTIFPLYILLAFA